MATDSQRGSYTIKKITSEGKFIIRFNSEGVGQFYNGNFVLGNSNPSSPPQSPAKISSSTAPVVNNISYTNTMTNGSTNGNGRKFDVVGFSFSFFFWKMLT